MPFKRVIIVLLDSVGVGALPDANLYHDEGSNTLGNLAIAKNGISLPNLEKHGLGNIIDIKGVKRVDNPLSFYGKMNEKSKGKDTTSGHWEIAGLILDKPFATFNKQFPDELINEFKEKSGYDILGNYPASGTEIIKELGQRHIEEKKLIIYTSADSVFQIAAHEEVIPIDELYRMSEIARKICDKYNIGRVIARPFLGNEGNFYRTPRRKDFSAKPFKKTILDYLQEKGLNVTGIGKIKNIFSGFGVTKSIPTENNRDGMNRIKEELLKKYEGLIFANLIDFDMLYGHRNNVDGYYQALFEFDNFLPQLLNSLSDSDLFIITADHGCDPTTESTDHSREYVPLIVHHKNIEVGKSLGIRETFSDIAKTISEIFSINGDIPGKSFVGEITT